jgi:hypothetical protein
VSNGAVATATRPIYQTATAIVAASGTVTIALPPVPSGYVWTGAISVPSSSASTLWTITAGAVPWGQTIGQAFGPVQCFGSAQIAITAAGLVPGTVFQTVFTGRQDSGDQAPVAPYPVATQVSGTVQIAGTTSIAGVVTIAETSTAYITASFASGSPILYGFTANTNTRRLTIIAILPNTGAGAGVNINLQLTGNTSGAVYYTNTVPVAANATARIRDFAEIEPLVDAAYTLTVTGLGVGQTMTLWVLGSVSNPLVQPDVSRVLKIGGSGGSFNQNTNLVTVANQSHTVILAAPPAGRSTFLQSVTASFQGAAGDAVVNVEDTSAPIAFISLKSPTDSRQVLFPSGYETTGTITYSSGATVANLALTFAQGPSTAV